MGINMNVVFAMFTIVSSATAGDIYSRKLATEVESDCGELQGCYLYSISSKEEIKLAGSDNHYCPTDSHRGWSVRCDTKLSIESRRSVDEITFSYNNIVTVEVEEPRWMGGDTHSSNKCETRSPSSVHYLSKSGHKEFRIEGTKGTNKSCFTEVYMLNDNCSDVTRTVPTTTRSVPIVSPLTETPSLTPTNIPTSVPSSRTPTIAPTTTTTSAPEQVPQSANCYVWTDNRIFFGYNVDIPPGTKVEVETATGQFYSYDSTVGDSFVWALSSEVEGYSTDSFHLRFVVPSGASGEWQTCINYYGIPNRPSQMEKCFLWSNRLYYGTELGAVSAGYKIEVRTVMNKYFDYVATGSKYITASDYRDYDSQKFALRVVDNSGNSGPWQDCVNYTPIALDLDRSGAVEHIAGEFIIDITGDGTAETLEEWFAPTEGILIDTKHGIEGGIVTGHHLFGDQGRTYIDGYEKLSLLDTNNDNAVSGDELDGLAIWIDANSNALLDDGEMSTLESHDIVSLSTLHDLFISTATLSDGSTIMMEDKWFIR